MANLKLAIFLLGVLFLCRLVQSQSDLDSTVGSTDVMTDPITFKFADEESAGAPADAESNDENTPVPESESFWSQSSDDVNGAGARGSNTEVDSFSDSQVYTDSVANERVTYNNTVVDGSAITTSADEEGFDMIEDEDRPASTR